MEVKVVFLGVLLCFLIKMYVLGRGGAFSAALVQLCILSVTEQ